MSRFRMPAFAFFSFFGIVYASTPAVAQVSVTGEWAPKFTTPNVMIHTSVLPNGKVLFWSRREAGEGLDPHVCTPRIWDPALGTGAAAFSPTSNKPGYNLFCSSHTFLDDGRLFVAGGHLFDQEGEPHATIYDPEHDTWTPLGVVKDMNHGRWYPTATTLPDGGVLVSFGTDEHKNNNEVSQVWKADQWRDLTVAAFRNPPYFPTMHVVSDGRVFMSGPQKLTQFLDTGGTGTWTPLSNRDGNDAKDYAPSVMYTETSDDIGKILYIGGGNAPTNTVGLLDLNVTPLNWKPVASMNFARRQHNATLLPDSTIVVMGGTQGNGFDNLTPGQPIRSAELWNPKTGAWTKLAKASVDRCYHSTAVLLPDATVLSAGGGEFRPNPGEPSQPAADGNGVENLTADTHKDAQIFSPPYLFLPNGTRASRPVITSAPTEVKYGDTFPVGTPQPDQIGKVSWVRLSSVTHSFNTNQRINVLKFATDTTATTPTLKVTAPANANLCPPGHYMLFVLNKTGVPSIAKIIKIHP
jgi:galactose oxidase